MKNETMHYKIKLSDEIRKNKIRGKFFFKLIYITTFEIQKFVFEFWNEYYNYWKKLH
jgi:hypothetical protein